MSTKMKIITAAGLAAALLLMSLAAGCGQPATPPSTTAAPATTAATTTAAATTTVATTTSAAKDSGASDKHEMWFDEPKTFKWLYADNAGFSLKEDWIIITEVKRRTNVQLEFIVVPNADYNTKMHLLLNSAEWPDVFRMWAMETEYAMNGILTPVSDYLNLMPYLSAHFATGDYDADLVNFKESDGKFYPMPNMTPWTGIDAGLITRVDYLKAHGKEVPKDYNEVYELMKYFKEQNPDSWPMSPWELGWPIRFMRSSWGIEQADHEALYYDNSTGQYAPAYTSPQMKSLLKWWAKGYAEGLVDPEIFTKGWDEMMQMLVTEKALFAFCWGDNTDATNSIARDTIPEFTLEHIVPPGSTDGTKPAFNLSKLSAGLGVPSAIMKRNYFEDLMRFFDWYLYSEEGAELNNWGVEGVTFNWKDGKRVFTDELLASPDGPAKQAQIDYGLFGQLHRYWMPDRNWEYAGAVCVRVSDEMRKLGYIYPARPMPKLSVDDIEEIGLLSAPINDAFLKARDDFVTGRLSIDSDWDKFVAEMESRGIKDMMKLYNDNLPK